MIKIGEFSTLAKTTIKTLRFYDEIGLFKPEFVDNNNYRYYSIEQLKTLQLIIDLRKLDMPTKDIKKILKGENLVDIFEKRLKELETNFENTINNITLIKNYLTKVKKGVFMKNYKAEKIVMPKCIVYYRKGVIESMAKLVPFILEAGEECRNNNPDLKCVEPGYCYVCYGAKEYKEKDVELEYAEAVENFGKESKNIKFKLNEKCNAISVKHKGPYNELGKAYAFALNYVKENGLEIIAPIRERYINGCWDCENEADYLTEIQIPIK